MTMAATELEYLLPYKSNCDLEELTKIKISKSQWVQKKSSASYTDILKQIDALQIAEGVSCDFSQDAILLGHEHEVQAAELNQLIAMAKLLIPWRKGPFSLFNQTIDAEWRSDFKWNRISPYINKLENKVVLDIGCNNGYFMFRMLEHKPKLVLGIDPVIHNLCQFTLLNKVAQSTKLKFELFGVEHVPLFKEVFDTIFSMGIIYHHRHPLQQLIDMREALRTGGQLILETIGIPGKESIALFPEDRYAKMRNVWFVPTLSCLINWVKRARFSDVQVISDSPLTSEEQRLTDWCPPPKQSLDQFLDPNDQSKTIEGHPAPRRFCILANKQK